MILVTIKKLNDLQLTVLLPAEGIIRQPYSMPEYISREKADAYRSMMKPGELLITADTIVWLEGKVLGKPEGREGAVEMLRALSGKSHQVFTGVCLTTTEWQKSFTDAGFIITFSTPHTTSVWGVPLYYRSYRK